MAENGTEQRVIGSLLRNPTVLLQKDTYQLSAKEFNLPLYQYAFYAIANMVENAAQSEISISAIENWLGNSSRGQAIYEATGGRQALVDALKEAESVSDNNFGVAYDQFKKENLVKDLIAADFKTDTIFVEDAKDDAGRRINDKFSHATTQTILDEIDERLLKIKMKYGRGDSSKSQTLYEGLEETIDGLQESPEIGPPLQGKYFNYIVGGALNSRFYLRSGSSGLGKTRSAMGDACHLAFPLRYEWENERGIKNWKQGWHPTGNDQKVLFIITEQDVDEIQKMAIAYLTGINESVFKKGLLHSSQEKVKREAYQILRAYETNFQVVRIPSPSISVVKQIIREHVKLNGTKFIFYDYIFESPAFFSEFKGMNLRTDQMLFMFSDALKSLAVELDIFMMSSTQVNAKSDTSKDIRNEASLAGSRAVINKADMGCIMARPSTEELAALRDIINSSGTTPNVVTDIYKLRGGEHTQVRIWSYIDLGTLRRQDLFVTDSQLQSINFDYENIEVDIEDEDKEAKKQKLNELLERLNGEAYDR